MLVVVVPTINNLKYLKRMIESLPHRGEAIIVIDQASTDETPQWLAAHPGLITLTQKTNIGVASAWNLGILNAFHIGATHVAVLNNDIILESNAMERLVEWEQRGLRVPTVKAIATSDDLPLTMLDQPIPWDLYPPQPWVSRPGDFCGFLVTPSLMDTIGWFDEAYFPAYCEDLDFEMRLLYSGLPHGMCHDALVYHFGSRSIIEGGVKNTAQFFKNAAYFQRKWGIDHETARRKIAQAGPPILP